MTIEAGETSEAKPKLFVHEGLVEQGVDGWRLIGSRCTDCGELRFPSARACPACFAPAERLARHALPQTGHVYTFSRVLRGSPPFGGSYVLAWVQLDGGPRVFCQLDCEFEAEVFGSPCELVVGALWETEDAVGVGYKFKVTQS